MRGLVVDLFAGGGGASTGLEAALGRPVDIAINHDAVALAAHKANHPHTRHLQTSVWDVKPEEATGGLPVDVLWASPDCTHFSVAKGGKPRKQKIRSLAWVVCRWAKAVRPRVIFLENVSEFRGWGPLGKDGKPIKARMGETFKRWRGQLERLGYAVDFQILDASKFGAPTRRRRLFLVARSDGQPIQWPEPTHGPGLLPLRTAAECIDWSIPCPSIFERKRPLADKTLWRIAQGLRKFVLENPEPFIVRMAHGEVAPDGVTKRRGRGAQPVSEPLPTVTGSGGGGGFAIATPALMKFRGDSPGAALDVPAPTVTAGGQPRPSRPATGNPIGLFAPILATIDQQGARAAATEPGAPLPTTVAKNRHALIAPTLVQTGYGEREGQAARVPGLGKPLGTIISGGTGGNGKHALVAAFVSKAFNEGPDHWKGAGSQSIEQPAATITSRDHHNLAAATLVRFNHDDHGVPLAEPMPTVTAKGEHIAEVRAFLTAYYGTDGTEGKGQSVLVPMRTVTTKARLGVVVVEGTEYQIVDIGMRMLEPHELLAAQFGRFAAAYDLSSARTKAGKVRLIGNSVCPEAAEALVLVNLPDREERAA